MATNAELQSRVDYLEGELKRIQLADAEAKAEALRKQQATEDATDSAAQIAAAVESKERIRFGAWSNYFLAKADPSAPLDFAALDEAITATEPNSWPPGLSESDFVIPAAAPKEDTAAVASTFLGKTLANLTHKI